MRRSMTWVLMLGFVSGAVVVAAQSRAPQSPAPQSPAPQSPAPEQSRQSEVALDGYCPVAYVEMNQAVEGNPSHSSVHEGQRYHFANADAKRMFDRNPGKYEVAYDGWCATAVAMNMKLEADPELFTVHEGRTYLFSDADAKAMFDGDKAGIIAKADANWATLAGE